MRSNDMIVCRSPLPPHLLIAGLLCVISSTAVSCRRGPARIYPPQVNAAQAAADAVDELDQNDDGLLSSQELQDCPGLYDKREQYDENDDDQVSADEIKARISELSRDGVTGLYSLAIRFTLNGAPLSAATIDLLPEDFLGKAVRQARGVTSSRGLVRPQTEGVAESPLYGVQPGIYRIAVTGPTEQVTSRYGSGELLGIEVSEACLGTNIVFQLTTE